MLPHIAGQNGPLAIFERRARVARLLDGEVPVGVLDQPGPARAEQRDRRVAELLLEGGEPAEALVDGVGQRAARLAAALGRQAVPVEGVVPDLSRVVEDPPRRLLDDLLQRQVSEFGARG